MRLLCLFVVCVCSVIYAENKQEAILEYLEGKWEGTQTFYPFAAWPQGDSGITHMEVKKVLGHFWQIDFRSKRKGEPKEYKAVQMLNWNSDLRIYAYSEFDNAGYTNHLLGNVKDNVLTLEYRGSIHIRITFTFITEDHHTRTVEFAFGDKPLKKIIHSLYDRVGTRKEKPKSHREMATQDIKNLADALKLYKMKKGAYPKTLEKLTEPNKSGDTFIDAVPVDPWGNEYEYIRKKNKFEITSFGADGREGGEKENADIRLSHLKQSV